MNFGRRQSLVFLVVLFIFVVLFCTFLIVLPTPSYAQNPTYGWTKTFGYLDPGYSFGIAAAHDSLDNIYITGTFKGSNLDFDPGAGTALVSEYSQTSSVYLTKFATDETYEWTKVMGGAYQFGITTRADVDGIAIDHLDNIYLLGTFRGTIDFDPSGATDNKTAACTGYLGSLFITKLNSDGSYGWTKFIEGSGNCGLNPNSIAIDGNNNVYIAGAYFSQVSVDFNFDGGSDLKSTGGTTQNQTFLTKINSDGTYGWTNSIGGTSTDTIVLYSVNTNTDNDIFFTGSFKGTDIDFDVSGGTDLKSTGGQNIGHIYISKIDPDNNYQWTKTIGSIGTNTFGNPDAITTDIQGNIYVVGQFNADDLDFDPGLNEDLHSTNGESGVFLTKFASDETYAWTKSIIMESGDVYHASVDARGNLYYTGSYYWPTDFDPSEAVDEKTITAAWEESYFLSALNTNGDYLWTKVPANGSQTDGRYALVNDDKLYLIGYYYQYDNAVDFDPEGAHDYFSIDSTGSFVSKYLLDTTLPQLSNLSPTAESSLTDATPILTFETNETSNCKVSLTDESYSQMSALCSVTLGVNHSCQVPDMGADGNKIVYLACSDENGNLHNASTNIEISYTLSTTTPTPSPTPVPEIDSTSPLRDFSLTDPNTNRVFSKSFIQTSLNSLNLVGNLHYPSFCFTRGYDEGSGLSHYTIVVDGQDYLSHIPAAQPPIGDNGDTKKDGESVIKENDWWNLNYHLYNDVSKQQEICAYGKNDSHFLPTGVHSWFVKAVDNKGNSTSTDTHRFLVMTNQGVQYKTNQSVWFPLTLSQVGDKTKLQNYTSYNPTLFTSLTKPIIFADTTPTLYGIAIVGTQVKAYINQDFVDLAGIIQRKQIFLGETTTNANSEWGINIETPLALGDYYLTIQSADNQGNFAILKDIPIKLGTYQPANETVLGTNSEILEDFNQNESENTPKSVEATPTQTAQNATPISQSLCIFNWCW